MSRIKYRINRYKEGKCIVQLDEKGGEYMEQREFSLRLAKLREEKGVSAREMSLSIGQCESYMNGVENGANFPSMTVFFYICEYLNITPEEFFATENKNPAKVQELVETVKGLSDEQLESLIILAKGLKK